MREIKSTKEFVSAISSAELVVIDFYAKWCGPCMRIAPQFEELGEKYKNVSFFKINTDIAGISDVCNICSIESLPTFCFFRDGKCIEKILGANISEIEKFIKEKGSH